MKKFCGNVRKLWKQYLVSIVLTIVAIAFYLALEANTKASQAIVAFGTLILALVTALTIINSNAQEKRQREEELAKEKRDKRERLLNEIIDWAEDVANSAIRRQTIDVPELWKAKLEHKYHKSKGKYIGVIVSSSFNELSDSFKDANIKLDETISFLENILGGNGGNILALKDYETGIVSSVEKLLEEAAKIKTKGIS